MQTVPPSPAAFGIAVMGKASVPACAKTRLVPPLSYDEAALFNTAFLQDVADNLALAAQSTDLASYIAYGPPGTQPFFRQHLPAHVGLIETWLPNFGECLWKATTALFEAGHAMAGVLNSDSPTLPTGLLVQAAELLARPGDRAVLGPSTDGGYYFLGIKQPHRRLFEEIDWSTERVARQTLQRAAEIGLEVVSLDPWYDVDDAASLRILHDELLEGRPFMDHAGGFDAPHSRALMQRLIVRDALASRIGLPGSELVVSSAA